MDIERFTALQEWFGTYVQGFYSEDADVHQHMVLKEEHTRRVCKVIREIGVSLGLAPAELLLAETVALLHDVGRFGQYARYRTFNDFRSADHAQLGVAALRAGHVLDRLSTAEQDIVTTAVFYHNKRDIPVTESGAWLRYGKLVRDADKLDIFEMIVTGDEQAKMIPSPELKQSNEYSPKLVEAILAGRMPVYEELQSAGDQLLFRVSWVYGIYFPFSCCYMLQHHYVERMLSAMPPEADIVRVREHLLDYLQQVAVKQPQW